MNTATFTYNIADLIDGILNRLDNITMREQALTTQMETLGRAVSTLAQTVQTIADINRSNIRDMTQAIAQMPTGTSYTASASADKTFVAKPTPFNGKGSGAEARHFLAAFSNWAMSTGSLLNDRDLAGGTIMNHEKWIRSVLNFLTDDARSWALPHLEKIANNEIPFDTYSDFVTAFRKRF